MPRKPGKVSLESAKQLMLAAVAEQLGAKTPAVADAAGITRPTLWGMKRDHKGFWRGCRSAAKKVVDDLREKGVCDGEILLHKQHGYSSKQVSAIFHAVVALVAKERMPEYKAAARLGYSSAYFQLKKHHKDLYERACEDFGLHCPPNTGRVPDTLSARATMKFAAVLVNFQFCLSYVSKVVGKKAGWLYGAIDRYGPYWDWLREHSPGLPEGHLVQMTVWNEKTGKAVGHSPPENRKTYNTMRKAFKPNPIRSDIANRLLEREKTPFGFKSKSESGSVILQGPQQPVLLRGKEKGPLRRAQYAVIQALVKVTPGSLPLDLLVEQSGTTDARRVLQRLGKSDPDWAAVIALPGLSGRGYRILP